MCESGVWKWQRGNCPICASPTTRIATPDGDRAIADLAVGDLVYSVDNGAVVVVPIKKTGSTRVSGHRVLRVRTAGGAIIEMSPGHPTADGRRFADLAEGDLLDEQNEVVEVELVQFEHDETYDILPASDSGTYFAEGVLVGSTLFGQAEPTAELGACVERLQSSATEARAVFSN
jgi:hypothetical protein